MSGFLKAFDDKMTKVLDDHVKPDGTVKTGFDIIDYINAKYDKKKGTIRPGIDGGKITLFIGPSSSGKTTLAVQIVGNILSQYPESIAIHADCEKATNEVRMKNLMSGDAKERYRYVNSGVTNEFIYEQIRELKKLKLNAKGTDINKDYISANPPYPDEKILIPTPVIIDTLITLKSEAILEAEKLTGQMQATRAAKDNNKIIEESLDTIFTYEIPLFIINHIRDKVSNDITPPPALLKFLSNKETIPGGSAQWQMATYMMKLRSSKTLDSEEEFGVQGMLATLTIIKSRSGAAGQEATLVFDQHKGFSNILSNFVFMKECKKVGGAGRGYYIEGLPDVKFSQKTFMGSYDSNPTLKAHFDNALRTELIKLVNPELRHITENDYIMDGNVIKLTPTFLATLPV